MNTSSNTPEKDHNKIELEITDIAFGGEGIGRLNGKVYFIQGAIPGDLVQSSISMDKAKFAKGQVEKIIKPSKLRAKPQCQFSTKCGGCQWQDIPYPQQIEWKEKFVRDAFQKISHIDLPTSYRCIQSPKTSHYRNRILLRGTIFEDGSIKVGFFENASKNQIHIDNCTIASKEANEIIKSINNMKTKSVPQKFRLEIQGIPYKKDNRDACLFLTLHPILKPYSKIEDFLNQLQSLDLTLWAGLTQDLKEAPTVLFEEDQNLHYFSSAGQFQQVNSDLNKALRRQIQQMTDKLNPSHILDLFCGSGNLSLGLAKKNRKITGIEFNQKSIKHARFNVNDNSLHNIKYIAGDAKKVMLKLSQKNSIVPDLIIADPPRKGMKDLISDILKLSPKHIIYVSCDPTTLARDSQSIGEQYELVEINSYDFFPHTYHVETIALFKKK